MNNLDVNALGVSELNESEMMEIIGGQVINIIIEIAGFRLVDITLNI